MGKRQRDCVERGAPVGIIGREYCCRCHNRLKEAAVKATCPRGGKQRVLQHDTGRCITCSEGCAECGHPVRNKDTTRCRNCARRAGQKAAQRPCPRCGRPGYLRDDTGWCGPCSRPRRAKDPPRVCAECGQLCRHASFGLCSACWQRPERPFVTGENFIARLSGPPPWLADLIAHLAAGHSAARACNMIGELGRLLEDEHPNHPQAVLERARHPGRSVGSLARVATAAIGQPGRHRIAHGAQVIAVEKYPNRPEMQASLRLIVRAERPASPSSSRITFGARRGAFCAVMNANTSAVTTAGSLGTTEKKTFRSSAVASKVFVRRRLPAAVATHRLAPWPPSAGSMMLGLDRPPRQPRPRITTDRRIRRPSPTATPRRFPHAE